MPVAMVNVVSDAPVPGHGETAASPKPEPSASRISVTAAAAKAPPMIAAHATAELPAFIARFHVAHRGGGGGGHRSIGHPASLLLSARAGRGG